MERIRSVAALFSMEFGLLLKAIIHERRTFLPYTREKE